jgi:hypothetical protein
MYLRRRWATVFLYKAHDKWHEAPRTNYRSFMDK